MHSWIKWTTLSISLLFGFSSHSQNIKKTFDYKVSYGQIKNQMHHTILKSGDAMLRDLDKSYKKKCKKMSHLSFQKINFGRYINCGFDVNRLFRGHAQYIVNTKVHPNHIGIQKVQGAKVWLRSPFNIAVRVAPKNPDMAIRTLDYKRNLTGKRENPFYRNIEVRYTPYTSTGVASFGMFMPGAEVRPTMGTVRARGEKKIFWFIKAKADIDVTMDLGDFRFHSSHVFGSAVVQADGFHANGKPKLKNRLYMKAPAFLGVKHRGAKVIRVKVRGANFFTKVALFIAKVFKVKVNDIAKNMMNQAIKKHLNMHISNFAGKLNNGSLWKEVYQRSTLPVSVQFSKNLGSDIGNVLKDKSATRPLDLKDSYRDVCEHLAESTQEPHNYQNWFTLCIRGLTDVKLSVFHRDPALHKKGCYSYFFNPVGLKRYKQGNRLLPANKWWRGQCQHISRLHVTIRSSYYKAVDCVRKEMQKGTPVHRIAKICKGQFDAVIPKGEK